MFFDTLKKHELLQIMIRDNMWPVVVHRLSAQTFFEAVLDCNEAFCSLNRLSREEILSPAFSLSFHPVAGSDISAVLQQLAEDHRLVCQGELHSATQRLCHCLIQTHRLQDRHEHVYVSMVQDITALIERNNELAEQKAQYHDLIDNISDGIYILDLNGNVVFANKIVRERSGYSFEKVKNRNFFKDIIAPECKAQVDIFIETLLRGEKFDLFELCYFNARGDRTYLEVNAQHIVKNGQIAGILGSTRDITDRKRAEKQLLDSEEKFKTVTEQSLVAIGIVLDKKLIYVNEALCQLTGFSAAELLTTPFKKLTRQIHPDFRKSIIKAGASKQAATGKNNVYNTYPMNRKDGSEIWVYQYAKKITFQGQEATLFMMVDISERMEAERALVESEMTREALLNAIPDLMFQMSREGIFLNYKASHADQLAVSPHDFIGVNIQDVLPGDLARLTLGKIENTLLTRVMQIYEYSLQVPLGSGKEKQFEARMVPISDNDVMVIIRDITEWKNYEYKIMQSLREKEMLLKEIHHRVKNNLQIISSLLHLQSRRIHDQELLEKFRECQARIQSIAIIHTKLYQSTEFDNIDFGDYIQSLLIYLVRLYGSKCARIKIVNNILHLILDLDKAIPCGLIINELISNAIEHAFINGQGGTITLDLVEETDNRISLSVVDNGVGIPENIISEQTDSLGLILIHSLVEQLEGKLEVKRQNGTSFKITFDPGKKMTNDH